MNDFQESFDMLMVLGECRKHYRKAQDLYAARYPDRQRKSHMAFKRLADRFCRFGTVKQTRAKRRPIVHENNAAAVLAFAALNPHASSRQMERESGISQRSVLRILRQHKFQPDCMSLRQQQANTSNQQQQQADTSNQEQQQANTSNQQQQQQQQHDQQQSQQSQQGQQVVVVNATTPVTVSQEPGQTVMLDEVYKCQVAFPDHKWFT